MAIYKTKRKRRGKAQPLTMRKRSSKPSNKRRRSPKVLSTKTLSDDLQVLRAANATNSPLLRLPPEIRNTIWHLALGGRLIKVTRNAHCSTCCDGDSEFRFAMRVKALNREKTFTRLTLHDHWRCEHPRPARDDLSLSILLSCRQIHQEAALLPFTANTFSFETYKHLGSFLRKLAIGQARSITSISMYDGPSWHSRHSWSSALDPTYRMIHSRLAGLKRLVSVEHRDYTWYTMIVGQELFKLFAGMSISHVVVAMHWDGWFSTDEEKQRLGETFDWEELEAWEHEVEQKILAKVEEVDDGAA